MTAQYGMEMDAKKADVIVPLGGDGHMLHILQQHGMLGKPIYGMNLGTVGYVMNDYSGDDLLERIEAADNTVIRPLAYIVRGDTKYAWNEVTISRQTAQALKLRVDVDGTTRINDITCDGMIVATPLGSTAYNSAAGGQPLHVGSNSIALTPICPFRPRRWKGALLPQTVEVHMLTLDAAKRPAMTAGDSQFEDRDVDGIRVKVASRKKATLLFDPGHNLSERIMREQFAT